MSREEYTPTGQGYPPSTHTTIPPSSSFPDEGRRATMTATSSNGQSHSPRSRLLHRPTPTFSGGAYEYGSPPTSATERGGGNYPPSRRPWASSPPPGAYASIERSGSYPYDHYPEERQVVGRSRRPSSDMPPSAHGRLPARGEPLYAGSHHGHGHPMNGNEPPSPPPGYFRRSVSNVGSPPPSPHRVYSREEDVSPPHLPEHYKYPPSHGHGSGPDGPMISPRMRHAPPPPHHALGPPVVMRRRAPVHDDRDVMGYPQHHSSSRGIRFVEGEWVNEHGQPVPPPPHSHPHPRGYPPHYDDYEDAAREREYYESRTDAHGMGSNRISPSYSFPPRHPKDIHMGMPPRDMPRHPFANRAEVNQSIPSRQTFADESLHLTSEAGPSQSSTSPHGYDDARQDTHHTITNENDVPGGEKEKKDDNLGCTCKKSKCLKLYCQCFAASIMCEDHCRCLNCKNTPDFAQERQEAIRSILTRNPAAFDTKFQTSGGTGTVKAHKLGCKCRKSACLKKYCECYHAGVKCNDACRCIGCKNQPDGSEDGETDPAGAPSTARVPIVVSNRAHLYTEDPSQVHGNVNYADGSNAMTSPMMDSSMPIAIRRSHAKHHPSATPADYDNLNRTTTATESVVMDAAQSLACLKNLASVKPTDNNIIGAGSNDGAIATRDSPSSSSSSCPEIANLVSTGSDISSKDDPKDDPRSVDTGDDTGHSHHHEIDLSALRSRGMRESSIGTSADIEEQGSAMDRDTNGASVLLMAAMAMTELQSSSTASANAVSQNDSTIDKGHHRTTEYNYNQPKKEIKSQPLKKRKDFDLSMFASDTSVGMVNHDESYHLSKRRRVERDDDENEPPASTHILSSEVIPDETDQGGERVQAPTQSLTPVHLSGKNVVTPQRINMKDAVCEQLNMELDTEHDESILKKGEETESALQQQPNHLAVVQS